MTIQQALEHLINSDPFKQDAKHKDNAKLRVFLGRYRKGEVKSGAAVELLLKYGYSIDVKKPKDVKAPG